MMLNSKDYTSIIEDFIAEIDLPQQPAGLYSPIRYSLEAGGKRIRPMLTLAMADATGGDCKVALKQAAAVEMFHNFTLLHDDVMDNADMRRGRPTVHRRWDSRTAILSGDAMLTIATMLAADCLEKHRQQIMDLFNRTAMLVYEGQQLDMDFESRSDVAVEEYMEMISLKTAVLLGCACAFGAVIADAPKETVDAVYDYGVNLGLAFQLRDDYLDTYGDPMVFGKEIGGDIINDKKTWLRIMAATLDKSGVIKAEEQRPSSTHIKVERVRGVYNELGLPEQCHLMIDEYIGRAVACIEASGISVEGQKFFIDMAHRTSTRTH